jgi:hypothetical protein
MTSQQSNTLQIKFTQITANAGNAVFVVMIMFKSSTNFSITLGGGE